MTLQNKWRDLNARGYYISKAKLHPVGNNAIKKTLWSDLLILKKKFWSYIFLLNKKKIELANDFHNPYNLDFKTKNLVSESRYSWNIPFASQRTFFRSTIHFQF